MPKVTVNGQITDLVETNLAKFVAAKQTQDFRFAVAVNEAFIPKASYHNVELKDGDKVELVTPMQGG